MQNEVLKGLAINHLFQGKVKTAYITQILSQSTILIDVRTPKEFTKGTKSDGDYYAKLAQHYRGLGMMFEFNLFKKVAREFHRMGGLLRGGRK